jgi:hypothetical protein
VNLDRVSPTITAPVSDVPLERYLRRPSLAISEDTVTRLLRDGVDPLVARLDLEAAKLMVRRNHGWPDRRSDVAEREYKRFLSLHLWNPKLQHPLVPTGLIDTMWHSHILDTRAYFDDTAKLFGTYLHHFPYLGVADEESVYLHKLAFERFCTLYEWTFGESHLKALLAFR